MNIINIFKLTFSQIYNRKYMFFLSLLTVGVMFFYLDYMTYQSFEQYYQIWKAEDVLVEEGKNVYYLQYDDASFAEDNGAKAKEFLDRVKEKFPHAGGFYKTTVNIEQLAPYDINQLEWEELAAMDEELWQEITQDMLVVDKDLMELCEVSLENGRLVSQITKEEDSSHIPVLMGSGFKGQVNEGDVLTALMSDDVYEVAGFLDAGEEWITDMLFYTTKSTISLDECVVVLQDGEMTEIEQLMASSNLYFLSDEGKEKTDEKIQSIAKDMDISVSVLSFQDMVSVYKKENAETMRMAKIILFTGIVVVALTSVLNSVMTILSRKKDYVVMNICGVSYKDILKMICVENMIKMIIPFELSVIIMNQVSYYHNRYRIEDYMYIQNKAVFVMLLYMLILIVSCSVASVWYIKRENIGKVGGMFHD